MLTFQIAKFWFPEFFSSYAWHVTLDWHLFVSNDIISIKMYDICDDFDVKIVNFLFLDGDVPRSTSFGVNISQFIRFARAFNYVEDLNCSKKLLTQKLIK